MSIINKAGLVIPPPATPNLDWFPAKFRRNQVLRHLVQKYNWTLGAELGLWHGKTMGNLLADCPDLAMIGVDLWEPQPDNEGPEDYVGWDHEQHEAQCRGRLAQFGSRATIIKSRTHNAAKYVTDGSLDFVFIDADHSFEAVDDDIFCWTPKLQPNGWLIGHDINWPSVRRAVEASALDYRVGPDSVWMVPMQGWEKLLD